MSQPPEKRIDTRAKRVISPSSPEWPADDFSTISVNVTAGDASSQSPTDNRAHLSVGQLQTNHSSQPLVECIIKSTSAEKLPEFIRVCCISLFSLIQSTYFMKAKSTKSSLVGSHTQVTPRCCGVRSGTLPGRSQNSSC